MATFKSTLEWIDDANPFFVTPIMNLGQPVLTTSIPTAQIEKVDNAIQLSVNPDFFEDHSEEDCAGILAHELYHVVMNHLAEFDKFDNQQARIIAQECIVNDSVIEEGFSLPDIGLFYGEDWVEYNASFLPTKIVYDDLMKNQDELPEEVQTECSHESSGLDPREAFASIFYGADPDSASDSMKQLLDEAAQKAGTEFSLGKANTGRKASMKWVELINKIRPNTFATGGVSKDKPTWARPRRKLAGMDKRVMLPSRQDKNAFGTGGSSRAQIILALDTSGSIPRDKVDELLYLARTIPKRKLKVECCTFSTYHVPLDTTKEIDGQDIAMGGTDFDAIVKFVNSLDSKKEKHVVVVTDGYAYFGGWDGRNRAPDNLDTNWHWLILKGGNILDDRVTKNIYNYNDYIA